MDMQTLPVGIQADIEHAVSCLKSMGAAEVFLFGSLSTDTWNESSDIDLAVRGLEPGRFFEAYALASRDLGRELDLVDLDSEKPMAEFLSETKRLVRIA
jgi:predicted nucleotidyltransferase